MNDKQNRPANGLKRMLPLLVVVLMIFSLCACQTDFSKAADYTLDVNGGANIFVPDLSVIEMPGDSETVTFEITNNGSKQMDYTLSVSSLEKLPLVFTLATEQAEADGANANGTIAGGEKHRYTLTVSWPAEENSYTYAGLVDQVSVKLETEE